MQENKVQYIKEINLMNGQLFKAAFRSREARGMISSFLSSVTGI